MNQHLHAYYLLYLGYEDYIAARYLLHNDDCILQGVTLASTAVEKYIKAVLVAKGKTKKDIRVHLDKIDKLRTQLADCHMDFTDKIDEIFLEILGKAYKVRYYDDIQDPITIGFFIKQFLCELDSVVDLVENVIFTGIFDENGNNMETLYKRNVRERNEILTLNNYLFSGVTKKEWMEQPDNGFCVNIYPINLQQNTLTRGYNIENEYHGKMSIIEVNFEYN